MRRSILVAFALIACAPALAQVKPSQLPASKTYVDQQLSTKIGVDSNGKISTNVLPNLTVTPSMNTAQINAVLAQAASKPGSVVDFVTGTYEIARGAAAPSSKCYGEAYGLIVQNATDLTINLNGSMLNNAGTNRSNYFHTICLDNNRRLSVRNGFLDYKNPPFTQGTVLSVNRTPGSGSLTFYFDQALKPSFNTVQRIEHYNSSDPRSPYGMPLDYVFNNEPAGYNLPMTCDETTCTITNTHADQPFNEVAANQAIVVQSQIYSNSAEDGYTAQGGDAVRMIQNQGVTFDNVRVYAAAGMGFHAYGWVTGLIAQSDIELLNGSGVYIKPSTTRVQSTNADCVHLQEVRGRATIRGAVLNGCKDDAVNVYNFHSKITQKLAADRFVMSNGRPWIPGDLIRFIWPDGTIHPTTGVLQEIANTGPGDATTIKVFSAPTEADVNFTVESITAAAEFSITDSDMGMSRGRGVLPNGRTNLIANNRFHDMSRVGAIHVGSGAGFFEQAAAPSNVRIFNNTFDNVNMPPYGKVGASFGSYGGIGAGVIYIRHTGSDQATETPTGQLPNISIKGNSFNGSAGAAIYASGILSGDISDNFFSNWGQFPNNVFGGQAAFRNNNNCAISIGVAGRLYIGPQKYGTLTLPRICAIGRDNSAPSPAGDGVIVHQPTYVHQTGSYGNGSTYAAPVETRETWVDAPNGNTETTLTSFTLQLPPLPDPQSVYTFRSGFNVAPGNLIVKDGNGNTLNASNTACGSLGLTAQQPANWSYANNYKTWYRKC